METIQWREGKDAAAHYREWAALKQPSIPHPGPKYVCDSCRRVHYHSLNYCSSCPGKLVQVTATTYAELAEKLAGCKLGPY